MSTSPSLWINAGESSGDVHGALLVQALRAQCPELLYTGMAGPEMRAAGVQPFLQTEALSVMGFTEVLGQLPKISGMLQRIRKELRAKRPEALILIDAPDFHFRLMPVAHSLGIPIIYYISPKLWAWRAGRVEFLKRYATHVISILPFEVPFYASRGMHIDYVGHPLLDVLRTPEILQTPPQPERIGVLPGSRAREIETLLPLFSRAAELLSKKFPHLEFVLPIAPGWSAKKIAAYWQTSLPITLVPSAHRHQLMRSCRAIMAASGTATLETALLEVPTVVAYRFSQISYTLIKHLIQVPYISLPNLIMEKRVFPERIQEKATAASIAAHIAQWIPETAARRALLADLHRLPGLLGDGGATQRAARRILEIANIFPQSSFCNDENR